MNTRKFLLTVSALTILISVSAQAQLVAADQTTVQEVIEKGPAQVVNSWMEPKLVRTREVKDSDGNTTVINEPLIQERHEQVVVPTNKTTVTTTVIQQTEQSQGVEETYERRHPALEIIH